MIGPRGSVIGMDPRTTNPVEVASSGGVVIAEDGPRVLVYNRRLGPLAVTAFVLGLVAFILVANAVLFLLLDDESLPSALSWGLLAAAVPLVAVLTVVWRALAGRRRAPLTSMVPVAVFDRSTGAVSDGQGAVLGRLDQLSIQRRFQLGSSSPALVARLPDRTLLLAKGNPFTGGLGRLDQDLARTLGFQG